MPTSAWLLGVPDTSGDIYLANSNGNFLALATCSSSSSEPPVKAAGMLWLDLNEGRLKQRNQTNSQWVPVYALRNNQCIPIRAGEELSNIATLQPNVDGYVRCKNGVFLLESIDSPDVPMFGVNRSGIVPGVTTAQSSQPYKLLSNGTWGEPGVSDAANVTFSGAKEYAVAVWPARSYTVQVRVRLSGGGQNVVLQIGSGGSPAQTGYASRVSRVTGDDSTRSAGSDRCFVLNRTYEFAQELLFTATLNQAPGNRWLFSNTGGTLAVDAHADVGRGEVTLPGRLNYMRVLTGGAPLGSFNNTQSLDSGFLLVQS